MKALPLAFLLLCAAGCYANAGFVYSNIIPFLGGADSTTITSTATDASGNFYLTGSTNYAAFPTTPGVVQSKLSDGACIDQAGSAFNPPPQFPCPDAFVIKLDAQAKIVFATLLGGGGYEQAKSIAVDGAGNIYIAGTTTSGNFPAPPGQPLPPRGPTFIAKLNPAGTAVLHSTLLPGTGDFPLLAPYEPNVPVPSTTISIAVNAAGDAYFAASASPGFPVVRTPLQESGPMVFGKLDPSGAILQFGTYFGGAGVDRPSGIALDAMGNVYITGSTTSSDFPVTPGALQSKLPPGVTNSFIVKLNSTGNKVMYSTYLGASSFASALGIRVDGSGDAYVLGALQSAGFPVTAGAFETTYNPPFSNFLAKLNPAGTSLVYATFVSTNGLPPTLFDVDAAGNAYFAGQTALGFPVSSDALQPCIGGGGDDAFVAELKPDGTLAAATYLGGSDLENALGVAVSPDGVVVLAGSTASRDFPVTTSSALQPPGYFVSKLHIADPSNAGQPCLTLAIENAASFLTGPIAPGELVTLWGLNLGPSNGASMVTDSAGNVATDLAGVQVYFNGFPAPLLYAQAQQINAQVPWELAGQTTAEVHVEYNGAVSQTALPVVAPSNPGFFRLSPGSLQGAIINADGTINSPSNPAKAGSTVSIYGTGGGATSPPGVTGGVAPLSPLGHLIPPVSVQIDGSLNAEVSYAGSAPTLISGVVQINFKIPENTPPSATHTLVVKIGDASTGAGAPVTLATQ